MPPRIKIAVAVAFAFIALFIVREATALDLPADDPVGVISLVVPATQPPEPQPAESADTLVPNPITPEIPIPESPPVTTPGPPPTAAQVVP
ncbi:MAG: hypothetical protein GX868_10085, partial [Actinobacteria bacterium]|nr:hypothetical protein [Actinomycetota bacterium]